MALPSQHQLNDAQVLSLLESVYPIPRAFRMSEGPCRQTEMFGFPQIPSIITDGQNADWKAAISNPRIPWILLFSRIVHAE